MALEGTIKDFGLETLTKQAKEYDAQTVVDIGEKTGLGSSAAMSVAFTTSLFLARWHAVSLAEGKSAVSSAALLQDASVVSSLHCLCQAHNSFMQDKIGSGFDIQCAVYGSQIF